MKEIQVTPDRQRVLLYSGGMDSWLIAKLWKPDVLLYVNMHTSYSIAEIRKLPGHVTIVSLNLGQWEREDKIIPLRNLYLVAAASNYGDVICLGATAGDRVLDKSCGFAAKASNMLSFLYQPQHWTDGRDVCVIVPYKNYTKTDLVRAYKEQGGNLEEAWRKSFSCYSPIIQGNRELQCGKCKPCVRKWVAFANNDYVAPWPHTRRHIVENILPQIESGEQKRGLEDMEIKLAIEKTKHLV